MRSFLFIVIIANKIISQRTFEEGMGSVDTSVHRYIGGYVVGWLGRLVHRIFV